MTKPTNLTLRILKLFLDYPDKQFYSAEIARILDRGAGAFAPILSKLEGDGWLKSETVAGEESNGQRKGGKYVFYSITELGKVEGEKAISCEVEFWCDKVKI